MMTDHHKPEDCCLMCRVNSLDKTLEVIASKLSVIVDALKKHPNTYGHQLMLTSIVLHLLDAREEIAGMKNGAAIADEFLVTDPNG